MKTNHLLQLLLLSFLIIIVSCSESTNPTLSNKHDVGNTNLYKPICPDAYSPKYGKKLGIWSINRGFSDYSYYKNTLGFSMAVSGKIKNDYGPSTAVFSQNIMQAMSKDPTNWNNIVDAAPAKIYEIEEPLAHSEGNPDSWGYSYLSLVNYIINTANHIQTTRPNSELRISVSSTDISNYLSDYQFIASQCSNVSFMYSSYDHPLQARKNKWAYVCNNLPVKAHWINANYDYVNGQMFDELIAYASSLGLNELWLYCGDGEVNLERFSCDAWKKGWLEEKAE